MVTATKAAVKTQPAEKVIWSFEMTEEQRRGEQRPYAWIAMVRRLEQQFNREMVELDGILRIDITHITEP